MKKSPLNDAKWANRDPGTNMTQKEKLQNKGMYKNRTSLGNNLLNIGKSYLDWNDDGKITASDIGKEAASWMVGGPVAKGVLRGLGKGYKFLKGALKRESSSPMNHCDSEMMHSGGWGQVRKYNSPGTTGNKEGIKHNEKMREEIGTFKMPHSPLNKGHNIKASTTKTTSMVNDSIAAQKAWKAHKAEYLKKPGGQKEYDMEKGEFYYSPKHGKLRLIPTDDGEVQDRTGIEKWQLAPDRKSSALHQESEAQKRRRERAENESGETQFFYNRKPKPPTEEKAYNMTPDATPEESKAVRDKFDATYLKGRGPFTKKEGKKDACYHKVKSRVKVWPSAYASGQLVQCRKAGAANWGEKSKDK
jgi:hypothetical protein